MQMMDHLVNKQYHQLTYHIDGLVQERRNSSALAMELRLPCTNLSISQLPGKFDGSGLNAQSIRFRHVDEIVWIE